MAEFIQFAMVTPEDSYPVVWAASPLYDDLGTPVTCHIDHRRHLIEISPSVRPDELEEEISYATDCARQSLLYPLRRVPLMGEVD